MDEFKRIDWCRVCGWRRLDPSEGRSAFGTERWQAWCAAMHEDEQLHPCCNPDCRGTWGTGCWHCHSQRYTPKPSAVRRAMKRRNRAAREANRAAPRGTHFAIDVLAEKADRAERDRVNMPTLPRWHRGEWRHIKQRTGEADR